MDIAGLLTLENFLMVLDISLVSFLIYHIIKVLKNTRAINLLKGIVAIIVIKILSDFGHLYTLSWIVDQVITWGVVSTIIIFQPEIRRALEHIGRGSLFRSKNSKGVSQLDKFVDAIADASAYMSKRRVGALICIEMTTNLDEYIATGIHLNANVSSQLLINLFVPNTPLHDGAIIIRDNKIITASSYLPLSENQSIPKELGTRHRAAIGLSEVSDAIIIIASEETGSISVARSNRLYRDITVDKLRTILVASLSPINSRANRRTSFMQEIADFIGVGGSRHD